MSPAAPPTLVFDCTVENIIELTDRIIEKQEAVYKQIASVETPTFENVIKPYGQLDNTIYEEMKKITMLQNVSTDKKLRQKSREADEKFKAAEIKNYTDEKLFKAIESVHNNKEEMAKLDNEDRRYVGKLVKEFVKAGQKLPESKCRELIELKKKIVVLENNIKKTLVDEKYSVQYTRKELSELPDSFFSGRETIEKDGITYYTVTQNMKDIIQVVSVGLGGVADKLLALNSKQSEELVSLTQELITLRTNAAKMLGHDTHAEYVLTDRMLKTPGQVRELIQQFDNTINKAKLAQEMRQIAKCKTEKSIFKSLMSMFTPAVTLKKVAEYFSLDHVLDQVLSIYQNLFGLHILKKEDASTWHKDVQVYEVWEAADRSVFVGHIYLDLFIRNYKFTNAVTMQLQPGYLDGKGDYKYPVAAMSANFDNPLPNKPSLLAHGDIIALFHELGHVFHILCSRTKWASFSGLNVERDFIEVPAQMMEHWAWEPSVLKKIALHYKSGKPIPDRVLNFIIDGKAQNDILANTVNSAIADFDISIHNCHSLEFSKMSARIEDIGLHSKLRKSIIAFMFIKLNMQYGYIVGGYDAGLYSYLLSKVLGADMFATRFLKEGIDNPQTGKEFRKMVLEHGASRDAEESLKQFLGREFNNEAFERFSLYK